MRQCLQVNRYACFNGLTTCLVWAVLCLHANGVKAETYQRVSLQHRHAAALEPLLKAWVDDNVKIVRDGNDLLIKAPQQAYNQLQRVIRSLDKPRQLLSIAIYRGTDPQRGISQAESGTTVQYHSTYLNRSSRIDEALVLEGETLLITDTDWIRLPEYTREGIGFAHGVQRPINSLSSEVVKGVYYDREQANRWVNEKPALRLVPVITRDANQQAQISLQYSAALDTQARSGADESTAFHQVATETLVQFPFDQWQRLSNHHQYSQAPAIGSSSGSRKIVQSTQKASEYREAIWIKISRL